MENKLLSICIPTYNRAETLSGTLDALFTNPDFDADKIEVVVSDNASTDNTTEVVARYPQVRYFRNEINIGSNANFTILLGYAKGRYLRLMNDTSRFNDGMLGKILREIEVAAPDIENLYFANATKHVVRRKKHTAQGKNKLLGIVSFYTTWIGNFGIWRADFEKMDDKDRFVDTLLHQVDWTLRMAGNGKKTRVIADRFMYVEDVKNKGSYDVFDIFVTKYLSILKFNRIRFFRMKMEKCKLFVYFVAPRLFAVNDHTVNMTNREIIHKRYWYEPYYFPGIFLFGMFAFFKRLSQR